MNNKEEILKKIEQAVINAKKTVDLYNYGIIVESFDGVAKISGLLDVKLKDIVKTENNNFGIVMKIEEEIFYAVFFLSIPISENMHVFKHSENLEIKCDYSLLGKVINPLGEVLLNNDSVNPENIERVYKNSASIIEREGISEPLLTGVSLIDLLIPIGLGQKQLILGDKQTGKTNICLNAIINQANLKESNKKFAYCIYVAIGKKASEIVEIVEVLKKNNALENTIIVASNASECSAMHFIAPDVGVAIAEFFSSKNEHALVILDDLTKHAEAYREISLLMKKTPARNAFPSDIFYVHAKLLERAVKLKTGGSVTILPIIETLEGDISDYISTNVISITDGQIYLDKELFLNNQKPAINIGLSVSRIGSKAQDLNVRELTGNLKGELAQFFEYESFAKSVGDLDDNIVKIINKGKILMQVLSQKALEPQSKVSMLLILFIIINDLIPSSFKNLNLIKIELLKYIKNYHYDLLKKLDEGVSFKIISNELKKIILDFFNIYKEEQK